MIRICWIIVALLLSTSPICAYTPPIGIPVPPFGIDNVAPASPSPWTSAVAGFYYVDNTSGAATDTSNPNGWPTQPRLTIPATLAVGAVVEVHGGPYVYLTSGNISITANGTAQAPVFIRGIADGSGNKPIIKGKSWQEGYTNLAFITDGGYYIIEGFRFCDNSVLSIYLGGNYVSFRNNEVVNFQLNYDSGGRQLGSALTSYRGNEHHQVIYNSVFRDIGNYQSLYDNKMIAIQYAGVYPYVSGVLGQSEIWILNNDIYHNGQGMQFGADCVGEMVGGLCHADPSAFPNHFYIGFNTIHGNRENGIGMKMSRDFIISQNEVYDMVDIPLGGASTNADPPCASVPIPTAIIAGRAAADNMWVIFNRIHDVIYALRSNGQDEATSGSTPVIPKVYWIGNLVHTIQGGTNCFPYSTTDPYSSGGGGVGWGQGANGAVYMVDNTILNSAKGISFIGTGYYEVTGNLLANVGDPHTMVPTSWGTNKFDYNFFDPTARLEQTNSIGTIQSLASMQATGQELHSLQGNSLINSTTHIPATGSPAIGANVSSSVYDTFFSLYGINIKKDYNGQTRPVGAWTIGAFEAGSAPPPSGTILLQGRISIGGGVQLR